MRVVVGDTHGCLNELRALLAKVGYVPGRDDLVMLGDELDRGPAPVGVVAHCMGVGARAVMGNHEEKALRWLRHEARAAREPGYVNRSVSRSTPEARKAEWRSLSPEQVAWLSAAPLWLDLGDNWLAVHAGFEPKPLSEQDKGRVLRVQYVDPETGKMVPFRDDSLDQPAGSVRWQMAWMGPQNVVYGHAVHSFDSPQVDEIQTAYGTVFTVGLDTGCVYGGRLTAMVFDEPGGPFRFVQVQAEREYLPFPGPFAKA